MEKVSQQEVTKRLEEQENLEFKFLVTDAGDVFVALEPTTGKTFSHDQWRIDLVNKGLISPDAVVKGGYLVRSGGKLRYWGTSSTLPGANKEDLFGALEPNGAVIITAEPETTSTDGV